MNNNIMIQQNNRSNNNNQNTINNSSNNNNSNNNNNIQNTTINNSSINIYNNNNSVKLIDVLKNIFQNNKGNIITEETLLSLYYIFDQSIIGSLEIIDKELIKKYKFIPSERSFYVIEGRKGSKHMCLIDGDYCSCPSFNYSVLLRSDSVYCKHQITSFLAEIMSNVKIQEFDDTEYQNKVREIEEASMKTPTHHNTRKGAPKKLNF